MKKYFLTGIVTVFAVVAFVTCKKDDTKSLTKLEILQAHKWKYSAMTQTDGTNVTDLFTADNCEIDDVFEFKSDMNVVESTGTKMCFTGQLPAYTETYSLSVNQDTLHFQNEDVPTFIKSLTLDKMEWEAEVNKGGKMVTVNQILIKE